MSDEDDEVDLGPITWSAMTALESLAAKDAEIAKLKARVAELEAALALFVRSKSVIVDHCVALPDSDPIEMAVYAHQYKQAYYALRAADAMKGEA